MNSLWDIRIFLGLVPKESPCITCCNHNFIVREFCCVLCSGCGVQGTTVCVNFGWVWIKWMCYIPCCSGPHPKHTKFCPLCTPAHHTLSIIHNKTHAQYSCDCNALYHIKHLASILLLLQCRTPYAVIVLYSWRWAQWCPKHVEFKKVNKTSAFVTSCWFFPHLARDILFSQYFNGRFTE
jgi:hypothetical protein